jgi:hypothetical protein
MFRVCVEPEAAQAKEIAAGNVIDRIVRAKNVLRGVSFFHMLCRPDRYANQATE